MAIHVYRYSLFLDPIDVSEGIPQAAVPTLIVGLVGPPIFVDITVDDSAKDDLDVIMAQMGWGFLVQDPVVPKGITTRQVLEVRQVADTSTASVVFVDLLTIPITTDVGFLEIYATLTTNALVALGFARLTLDGVAIADGGSGHLLSLAPHAISKRVAIAAGAHTVALQWRTAAAGTLQCRPTTNPDQESATLIVRETT